MSSRAPLLIKTDRLSAEINPHGAELWSLRDAEGGDLLWNGDPAVWSGRAPVLFPIVGMLRGGCYRHEGKTYHLEKHGFARRRPFTVMEHTARRARLVLRADPETLAVYPFTFELELTFAIVGARLYMTAVARNLGQTVMPASFGFHPALRWPLPFGAPRPAHRIRFELEEAAPVRRIDREGLLRGEAFSTPVKGRDLGLRDGLFVDDALIFDRLASRRLRYGAPGGPELEVRFPDTPYLGLWTKPGADYLCIEPWHGVADPEDFGGDLKDKPGMELIDPGEERRFLMSIELLRPAVDQAPD